MARTRLSVKLALGCILIVLVAGNVWQYANLWQFTQTPIMKRTRHLPFVNSNLDFRINPVRHQWADHIVTRAKQGNRIILLYSFNAYPENHTDPAGVPDMIYLALGHEQFVHSIHIFSKRKKRYSRLPILAPKQLETVLEKISDGDATKWLVMVYKGNISSHFPEERERQLATIRERCTLAPRESFDFDWDCYDLVPLSTLDTRGISQ